MQTRLLEAEGKMSDMVERKSRRVFGVGVGVFLLGFFFVASMLICCIGSLSETPRLYYRRAITIFTTVVLYLFLATKQTQFVTQEETIKDYNVMRDVRIGLGIFMILCSLWGIKTAFVSALGEKVQPETFDEEVPTRRTFF